MRGQLCSRLCYLSLLPCKYTCEVVEFRIAKLKANNYCYYHSMIPQTSIHWTMLNAIAAGMPLGFILSPLLLRM